MTIRGILLGTAALALLASPAMAASSDVNARLDQLEQQIRDQNAEIQQLKAEANNQADPAQMNEATQAQIQVLNDKLDANAKADDSGWWNDTKISGRMYFDVTNVEQKSDGATVSGGKSVGFDMKRFYVGIDHKFNDMFSANLTTDVTYDGTAAELYVKKAYLDINLDKALDVRLGATDLPWIPFVEGVYGNRYVENVLIDRTKFGTSSDWGLHVKGGFADGMLSYAVSVVNGAGYKKPGTIGRSKGVDVEGRVSANFDNITLAVGGYTGKLGKDVQGGAPTFHTANRFDALAAYKANGLTAGIEYFSATNWNSVTSHDNDADDTDRGNGYSAFASYQFDPQWSVFGRYDWAQIKTKSDDGNTKPRDGYYNVGIAWSPVKIVDLALVYKHDRVDHGSMSTSNGTIGGVNDGTYNEVGIFGRFRW